MAVKRPIAPAEAPRADAPTAAKPAADHTILVGDTTPYCVPPGSSIRDVIARIDKASQGLALIVDARRRLHATITDGDICRAILAGANLDQSIETLLDGGLQRINPAPITAPDGTEPVRLLQLMNQHLIRHVPLVDGRGRLTGLALLSQLVRETDLPLQAVIMAGGFGSRLRPLTEETPKTMLPVGDRPLLERTLEGLRQAGIRNVNITTHFMADKIREHIGDGSAFGMSVQYNHEREPLGTAGALRLIDCTTDEPLLVINGDVLTTVNYLAMLEFHREHCARLTMGVRHCSINVPYGVVECSGEAVRAIREKPEISFFFNAGIYLLEPDVRWHIPADRPFDMTDLIDAVIAAGESVVSFPIHEYWLDIGRHSDYERAQADISNGSLGMAGG